MNTPTDRVLDQLFDLAVVMGGVMNQRLAEHGLTPARAHTLWLLHRAGPCTEQELSRLLRCTPGQASGLVDALQRAGFVERAADPHDRRGVQVHLNLRGRALIASWGADCEHGTGQLLGGIPADDLAVFSAVLEQVLVRLRAAYRVD
jgi:DNA-binding MarR family transcriptional regulator